MKEKKAPEIRFKGFTDDWEQRKLSELVERYDDPVETPHDGYIRLGIRSHAKGTFHEYVEPGHELETAQMHRVAANKLIFNITFAWEHAVAITDKNDAGKLVSHRFPQFTLLDLIRPEFLKYVILDEDFHHNLYLASPGGAGRNRVLKIDEALDYPIYYPSVDEQHKIGVFLDKLSDLITLHQRKHKKLLSVKKSMLEKMFPQNGAKVPEIRFEGFTDDWEQRKLDDLCSLVTKQTGFDYSSTIKPSLVNEHLEGTLPFIQNKDFSGNNINMDTDFYIPEEVVNKYPKITLDQPCLLISISGKIGNVGLYKRSERAFIGGAVGICRLLDDTNGEFIMQELLSDKGQHYFQSLIKASSHQNITVEDIRKIEIPMPSASEQKKISQYFEQLDNLITLHQSKLEKLRLIKKSMLDQMFV